MHKTHIFKSKVLVYAISNEAVGIDINDFAYTETSCA